MRHPNVTLRTTSSLCKAKPTIDQYFDILEEAVTVNNLFDMTHQVFNLNKTGVLLDPKPVKIVASHGEKILVI